MPTRKWGIEKLVDTTTTGNQLSSQVAVLAGGSFVVVWQDGSGASSAIRAQRYDAAGNRLGGEIAIAVVDGFDQVLPSVTGLADGGFYVTWTELVGADNYILGAVYDASGAFVRSQTATFAFGQDTDSQVVRFVTGSAVAWYDPDNTNILFRIFDAAGNGTPLIVANTGTAGAQLQPAIAASPYQTILAIVWVDNNDFTIQGRLFDAAGNQFAPQFRIDASLLAVVSNPVVTWLNLGQFVVVWQEGNSFSSEIKARIFDGLNAIPTTGNILVNSTTAVSQQSPTVTAVPNGGFVVAWEDFSGIGVDSDFAIRLQGFDGSGTKIGGEIVVNTTTTGDQFRPSIAALPDGRVVVSWTDFSQTGGDASGGAIRMQIVDPRDGIVTGTPASETLYGHDLVNDEISAGAGNDTLFGLRGDDALYGGDGNDVLNGGIGADTMYGGTGNDIYIVDNVDDAVTENPGEGTDTVKTTLSSYVLGANLENLTFTGAGNFTGTGNILNNRITGGAGNDTLSGGNGNDTLLGGAGNDAVTGGLGNDNLTGGTGQDAFRFDTALNAATNVDRIFDFSSVDDTALLSQSVFTAAGALGTLTVAAFFIGANAHDADDRIIYTSSTGALKYDPDGNGATAATRFATLSTGLVLTNTDFQIV